MSIHVARMPFLHLCADCGETIFPGQQYKRVGKQTFLHSKPICKRAASRRLAKAMPLPIGVWKSEEYRSRRTRLRIYTCICAEKDYTCYECHRSGRMGWITDLESIYAGDSYFAEVWLINQRIEVRRFHFPQCPFPPDFDDFETEDVEEIYSGGFGDYELPNAA